MKNEIKWNQYNAVLTIRKAVKQVRANTLTTHAIMLRIVFLFFYVVRHIGFMQIFCASSAQIKCCMTLATKFAVVLRSHLHYLNNMTTNEIMKFRHG